MIYASTAISYRTKERGGGSNDTQVPVELLQIHETAFQGFHLARELQLHFHICSTTKINNKFEEMNDRTIARSICTCNSNLELTRL